MNYSLPPRWMRRTPSELPNSEATLFEKFKQPLKLVTIPKTLLPYWHTHTVAEQYVRCSFVIQLPQDFAAACLPNSRREMFGDIVRRYQLSWV